jgi:hypothetical protein
MSRKQATAKARELCGPFEKACEDYTATRRPHDKLDKASKALMLGQELLSFAEEHSLSGLVSHMHMRLPELQADVQQFREVCKGLGKGKHKGGWGADRR